MPDKLSLVCPCVRAITKPRMKLKTYFLFLKTYKKNKFG